MPEEFVSMTVVIQKGIREGGLEAPFRNAFRSQTNFFQGSVTNLVKITKSAVCQRTFLCVRKV